MVKYQRSTKETIMPGTAQQTFSIQLAVVSKTGYLSIGSYNLTNPMQN